ncbi:MAG TPA: hypothetical protein VMA72_17195 [Streptosporangiaceae bacterium]|nr:hypothetical protein [Streptosporangiaceae bacterium]
MGGSSNSSAQPPVPGSQQPSETTGEGHGKKWTLLNSAFAVAIIGLIGVLAGVFIPHFLDKPPATAAPKLEVDSVTVDSPQYPKPTNIFFKIRNTGDQLAVITGVTLRIDRSAQLPVCFSQGSLPVSGHYPGTLPPKPPKGYVTRIPVSQQIGPDEADQFEVQLRPSNDIPSETITLYDATASIIYDNRSTPPLGAGKLTLSMPRVPNNQYYFSTGIIHTIALMGSAVPSISRCMIRDSKLIRSFLTGQSARSSEFSSLLSAMSYCCVAKVPTVTVMHCQDKTPLYRPSSMPIACDGSESLEHLTWSEWSFSKAAGTGVAKVNDCSPSCAAGRFHSYPVTVTLNEPEYLDHGWEWAHAVVVFPGKHPAGNEVWSMSDFSRDGNCSADCLP